MGQTLSLGKANTDTRRHREDQRGHIGGQHRQLYKIPKRNTGKEIQTKGCRRKFWICFRVISIFFSMQTISAKIITFVFFRNCSGASVMHCSKASVGNCSSTSVEMSNCQLFRPDLIFRLPSQPRASVNRTKCHWSSPLSTFNRSSPLNVVKFLHFCQF